MELVTTYQGSVNRWECDENDHQNVRFFLTKHHQGLVIALQKLCITDHQAAPSLLFNIDHHHIRFLREARVATPLVLSSGVLAFTPGESLRLLSLMRNGADNSVNASFITEFNLARLSVDPPTTGLVALPEQAQPNGVANATSAYAGLDYNQALDHGFLQVGAGVISAAECISTNSATGTTTGSSTGSNSGSDKDTMERHHYMGRISDGMPNLWNQYQTGELASTSESETTGGAVLEYRQQFHADLHTGDSFVHLAGIHSLGSKTYGICHLVFAASTGQIVVSAEALGISMDLVARKAIAIPADRRARMESLKLRAPAG